LEKNRSIMKFQMREYPYGAEEKEVTKVIDGWSVYYYDGLSAIYRHKRYIKKRQFKPNPQLNIIHLNSPKSRRHVKTKVQYRTNKNRISVLSRVMIKDDDDNE
jgi:hypothetical protein